MIHMSMLHVLHYAGVQGWFTPDALRAGAEIQRTRGVNQPLARCLLLGN